MHPEIWTLPGLGWSIKSYGFMLMCGFLLSIYLAMRRAERVKADPDLILNMGFVSLLCGVGGARIFYVVHYWKSSFAWHDNPLAEAFNITAGGLEYYGGLVGAILGCFVYLRFWARFNANTGDPQHPQRKRPSVRLYLDIVAPAAMLGLAFGRAGCFLNGCCWGGICVQPDTVDRPALSWAMTFPYGSPAYYRQWENRQITVPAELIYDNPSHTQAPFLVMPESLNAPVEEVEGPVNRYGQVSQRFQRAKAEDPDSAETKRLEADLDDARQELREAQLKHGTVYWALRWPSRTDPQHTVTRTELADLAAGHRSLPVHPAQLYGLINAVLLSLLLEALFYRRKRHGLVFAVMLVLYPITRVILELIRVDNPHDVGGMTISQAVSLAMLVTGVIMIYLVCYRFPARSPQALPYVPPPSASENAED